jgi:hypothetical protein
MDGVLSQMYLSLDLNTNRYGDYLYLFRNKLKFLHLFKVTYIFSGEHISSLVISITYGTHKFSLSVEL